MFSNEIYQNRLGMWRNRFGYIRYRNMESDHLARAINQAEERGLAHKAWTMRREQQRRQLGGVLSRNIGLYEHQIPGRVVNAESELHKELQRTRARLEQLERILLS
jgi:hypothetical protein